MRQLLNRSIRYIPSEKGKGIAGSAIFHTALLLILIFFAFTIPEPPETEEGILVNFGTDETGFGMIEPSEPAVQAETSPPPPSNEPLVEDDVPLLTQETEEAPEIKKVDPEVEKRRLEKLEAERKLREQLEAERIKKEAEEAERKRIEAEEKRAADAASRTRNALANSKNAGTTSKSEGEAGGTGNQGVPTGSVNTKVRGEGSGLGNDGISFDLGGRGSQSLPRPKYEIQDEGTVVVEIYVDQKGNVTRAVAGVKGSNTLNEYLLRVAREAALQARFQPDPNAAQVQKGTITYNFKLR